MPALSVWCRETKLDICHTFRYLNMVVPGLGCQLENVPSAMMQLQTAEAKQILIHLQSFANQVFQAAMLIASGPGIMLVWLFQISSPYLQSVLLPAGLLHTLESGPDGIWLLFQCGCWVAGRRGL